MNYQAVSLALQIVEDFDPDVRITGSDGVDFYSLSSFDKDPKRISSVQEELDSWAATQRSWLSASPNATNYFIIGNHEDRLRRWLCKHPGLHGLNALSFESLFQFDKLNIQMGDKDGLEVSFYNKLLITHGSMVRKFSAYTARGEAEKIRYSMSVMTGHTHRGGRFFTTTRDGICEAVECFCLCSMTPEYVCNPDWQHGIVLAEVDKELLSIEMIPFHSSMGSMLCRWRGKEYKA